MARVESGKTHILELFHRGFVGLPSTLEIGTMAVAELGAGGGRVVGGGSRREYVSDGVVLHGNVLCEEGSNSLFGEP